MRRGELAVCAGLLIGLALLTPAALHAASEKANRAKCANHLRMLALASIQYADDKRFYPHVGSIRHLDRDLHSPDTPKVVRTLLWYGYHDSPEGWICPSSDDHHLPIRDKETNENLRLWSWERKRNAEPRLSPLVQKGGDPNLAETTELSYGWTRRGLNLNARASSALAADRAVRDGRDRSALRGNHDDGWNVAFVDGSVRFHAIDAKVAVGGSANGWLLSTQQGGAYLSCKAQPKAHSMGSVTARPAATPWTGTFSADGKTLTLQARSWSERESSWSFRGTLDRGGAAQPVWGRVQKEDGSLKGVVDGPQGPEELSLKASGEDMILSVGGASATLARTAAADTAAGKDDALREGVVRALFSALRTDNEQAAEALLSKDMLARLEGKPWRKELLDDLERLGEERIMTKLLPFVQRVEGTLKISPPKPREPRRPQGRAVVGVLKTIVAAQTLFREGDKENDGTLDYASSLQELIDVGLITKDLAGGMTADGYQVEVCHGSAAPEFLWMAVARGPSGSPFYAVNHEGVVQQADAEIKLDRKDCKIRGGVPLGR